MGNHDSILKRYIDKFGKLKTKFQLEGLVTVEITVHRTLFVVEIIAAHQILDDLKYAAVPELLTSVSPEHATQYSARLKNVKSKEQETINLQSGENLTDLTMLL